MVIRVWTLIVMRWNRQVGVAKGVLVEEEIVTVSGTGREEEEVVPEEMGEMLVSKEDGDAVDELEVVKSGDDEVDVDESGADELELVDSAEDDEVVPPIGPDD